jgi:hypothetical protein
LTPKPYTVASPKTAEIFTECIACLQDPMRAERHPLAKAWLAGKTVQTLSSCVPPAEPRSWDWEGLLSAASDRDDRAAATRAQTNFREAWNDILEHESECAARVLEVLRAWLWAIEGAAVTSGAPKAQHEEHAVRCRQFLVEVWDIRLAEPPELHAASRVATRLTRRYDLMPRNVREWWPE